MGILDFFMGIQDPVEGEYRISAASHQPTGQPVAGCDMVGEVSGEGLKRTEVVHYSPITSIAKWPHPGDVLPVLVDRANPDFLRIQWKDVPERI
jgi:hypothetical protein